MRALVCGVGGQDGAYLSQLLLRKGYQVIGTSRDAGASDFARLKKLGIAEQVELASMSISDFRSVLGILEHYQPDEIYNLAGQTSVGLSFEQPVETIESIAVGTLNLLEAIRYYGQSLRFYNAGSSESFGDTSLAPATESSPFHPRSPYAVAKVTAHNLVSCYREAYGLYACTGVLFNHESPLRPERFVTQKIVRTAARIAQGSNERLEMGNIQVVRDWGWAPEYVEAMWLMLQQEKPQDVVIATGKSVSLEYFIDRAFNYFGLRYSDHLIIKPELFRPSDITVGSADPGKAKETLGWVAGTCADQVVDLMCEAAKQDLLIVRHQVQS